jgi:nucleoid DNA-binding protein
MDKTELAKRLAKRSGVSPAEAADQLDQVVNGILAQLRRGEAAPLPGLGTFTPGRTWRFAFEPGRTKGTHGKSQ